MHNSNDNDIASHHPTLGFAQIVPLVIGAVILLTSIVIGSQVNKRDEQIADVRSKAANQTAESVYSNTVATIMVPSPSPKPTSTPSCVYPGECVPANYSCQYTRGSCTDGKKCGYGCASPSVTPSHTPKPSPTPLATSTQTPVCGQGTLAQSHANCINKKPGDVYFIGTECWECSTTCGRILAADPKRCNVIPPTATPTPAPTTKACISENRPRGTGSTCCSVNGNIKTYSGYGGIDICGPGPCKQEGRVDSFYQCCSQEHHLVNNSIFCGPAPKVSPSSCISNTKRCLSNGTTSRVEQCTYDPVNGAMNWIQIDSCTSSEMCHQQGTANTLTAQCVPKNTPTPGTSITPCTPPATCVAPATCSSAMGQRLPNSCVGFGTGKICCVMELKERYLSVSNVGVECYTNTSNTPHQVYATISNNTNIAGQNYSVIINNNRYSADSLLNKASKNFSQNVAGSVLSVEILSEGSSIYSQVFQCPASNTFDPVTQTGSLPAAVISPTGISAPHQSPTTSKAQASLLADNIAKAISTVRTINTSIKSSVQQSITSVINRAVTNQIRSGIDQIFVRLNNGNIEGKRCYQENGTTTYSDANYICQGNIWSKITQSEPPTEQYLGISNIGTFTIRLKNGTVDTTFCPSRYGSQLENEECQCGNEQIKPGMYCNTGITSIYLRAANPPYDRFCKYEDNGIVCTGN